MERQQPDLIDRYVIVEARFVDRLTRAAPEKRAGIIADNLEDIVNLRVGVLKNLNAGNGATNIANAAAAEQASPITREPSSLSLASLVQAAKNAKQQ